MRIWGYSESEAGLTFANLRLEYESESGANFTSVINKSATVVLSVCKSCCDNQAIMT